MAQIQMEFDVPAKMRDGTVLRADVYRPGGSGPRPVLLSRLPYVKQSPMVAMMLSKPPELKAIAPLITWSDPDHGLWTRGGAIELGITVPWSLLQGADTLMRRHATDLDGLVNGITGLVQDFDGLVGGGYRELPAGRFPAFARHDLPELGSERSRREPEWARSCRVAGRHDEVDLYGSRPPPATSRALGPQPQHGRTR